MEVENGKVNGTMPPRDPIGKPPLGPFGTKVSAPHQRVRHDTINMDGVMPTELTPTNSLARTKKGENAWLSHHHQPKRLNDIGEGELARFNRFALEERQQSAAGR